MNFVVFVISDLRKSVYAYFGVCTKYIRYLGISITFTTILDLSFGISVSFCFQFARLSRKATHIWSKLRKEHRLNTRLSIEFCPKGVPSLPVIPRKESNERAGAAGGLSWKTPRQTPQYTLPRAAAAERPSSFTDLPGGGNHLSRPPVDSDS